MWIHRAEFAPGCSAGPGGVSGIAGNSRLYPGNKVVAAKSFSAGPAQADGVLGRNMEAFHFRIIAGGVIPATSKWPAGSGVALRRTGVVCTYRGLKPTANIRDRSAVHPRRRDRPSLPQRCTEATRHGAISTVPFPTANPLRNYLLRPSLRPANRKFPGQLFNPAHCLPFSRSKAAAGRFRDRPSLGARSFRRAWRGRVAGEGDDRHCCGRGEGLHGISMSQSLGALKPARPSA